MACGSFSEIARAFAEARHTAACRRTGVTGSVEERAFSLSLGGLRGVDFAAL